MGWLIIVRYRNWGALRRCLRRLPGSRVAAAFGARRASAAVDPGALQRLARQLRVWDPLYIDRHVTAVLLRKPPCLAGLAPGLGGLPARPNTRCNRGRRGGVSVGVGVFPMGGVRFSS